MQSWLFGKKKPVEQTSIKSINEILEKTEDNDKVTRFFDNIKNKKLKYTEGTTYKRTFTEDKKVYIEFKPYKNSDDIYIYPDSNRHNLKRFLVYIDTLNKVNNFNIEDFLKTCNYNSLKLLADNHIRAPNHPHDNLYTKKETMPKIYFDTSLQHDSESLLNGIINQEFEMNEEFEKKKQESKKTEQEFEKTEQESKETEKLHRKPLINPTYCSALHKYFGMRINLIDVIQNTTIKPQSQIGEEGNYHNDTGSNVNTTLKNYPIIITQSEDYAEKLNKDKKILLEEYIVLLDKIYLNLIQKILNPIDSGAGAGGKKKSKRKYKRKTKKIRKQKSRKSQRRQRRF